MPNSHRATPPESLFCFRPVALGGALAVERLGRELERLVDPVRCCCGADTCRDHEWMNDPWDEDWSA